VLPFGVDECEQYPLFTPELIALMRRLIPPARQSSVARSVIFRAHKPGGDVKANSSGSGAGG